MLFDPSGLTSFGDSPGSTKWDAIRLELIAHGMTEAEADELLVDLIADETRPVRPETGIVCPEDSIIPDTQEELDRLLATCLDFSAVWINSENREGVR